MIVEAFEHAPREIGRVRCASMERFEVEETIVTLAGWAWERAFGNPLTGAGDVWNAAAGLKRSPRAYLLAIGFVEENEGRIRRTGDEILSLMNAQGLLRARKLDKLVAELSEEVRGVHRVRLMVVDRWTPSPLRRGFWSCQLGPLNRRRSPR